MRYVMLPTGRIDFDNGSAVQHKVLARLLHLDIKIAANAILLLTNRWAGTVTHDRHAPFEYFSRGHFFYDRLRIRWLPRRADKKHLSRRCRGVLTVGE